MGVLREKRGCALPAPQPPWTWKGSQCGGGTLTSHRSGWTSCGQRCHWESGVWGSSRGPHLAPLPRPSLRAPQLQPGPQHRLWYCPGEEAGPSPRPVSLPNTPPAGPWQRLQHLWPRGHPSPWASRGVAARLPCSARPPRRLLGSPPCLYSRAFARGPGQALPSPGPRPGAPPGPWLRARVSPLDTASRKVGTRSPLPAGLQRVVGALKTPAV